MKTFVPLPQIPFKIRPGYRRDDWRKLIECELPRNLFYNLGWERPGWFCKGVDQGLLTPEIYDSRNSFRISMNGFHRLPGQHYIQASVGNP